MNTFHISKNEKMIRSHTDINEALNNFMRCMNKDKDSTYYLDKTIDYDLQKSTSFTIAIITNGKIELTDYAIHKLLK